MFKLPRPIKSSVATDTNPWRIWPSRIANPLAVALCLASVLNAGTAWAQPFVATRNAQCVAFAPDGKTVATGKSGLSNGATPLRPHPSPRKCAEIQLWDAATGEQLHRMESFGDLTRLAFSPDGKLVAASRLYRTGDGLPLNEVHVWNAKTGKSHRAFERVHAFDFSPDSKSIAVVSARQCAIFNLQNGERLGAVKPLGGSLAIRYTPDGKQLVGIATGKDGYQLIACDISTGKQVAEALAFEEPFYSMAVSPDGTLIATGHAGGNVLVWKRDTLGPLKRLRSGDAQRLHPVFSPDSTTLACGGQQNGTVVFFDVVSGRENRRMRYDRGDFPTVMRRDEEEQERPETDPARFAFSPDGELFLAGCYGGILRRMDNGNEVRRLSQ